MIRLGRDINHIMNSARPEREPIDDQGLPLNLPDDWLFEQPPKTRSPYVGRSQIRLQIIQRISRVGIPIGQDIHRPDGFNGEKQTRAN